MIRNTHHSEFFIKNPEFLVNRQLESVDVSHEHRVARQNTDRR